MKNKIATLFIGISLLNSINANSQLTEIPLGLLNSYDTAGWVFFKPGMLEQGEFMTTFDWCFFTDPGDTLLMERTWQDTELNLEHYYWSQYHKGINVEGCEFIEHVDQNGYIVYANGKICSGIGTRYTQNTISEEQALSNLLSQFSTSHKFAWQDTGYENEIKNDLNDTNATHFPIGELVFTTNNWQVPIQYDMNPLDYRLAWKFDIYCIEPSKFHKYIYVDAITGSVFKELDQHHYDTPAIIPYHGSVTVDSRWVGWPTNKHLLHTNDEGRNVHTKYDGILSFDLISEIGDSDGDWETSEQGATGAHYGVTKAWDYFADVHGKTGMDGSGNKVKVLAEANEGTYYHKRLGIDRIYVGRLTGDIHAAELSILGHEYTHGINAHSGELTPINESSALDESFADIFGFMVKRYALDIVDWEVGPDAAILREKRSLQNPKSKGFHYDIVLDLAYPQDGQPDTYQGDYWFPYETHGADQGGIHVNSGVQNHWFYILSWGKSGINDYDNNYSVTGIGLNKAAKIAYYNLTNNMISSSKYVDAKLGSIEFAKLFYGECSFEHQMTMKAWYAVGLGESSYCADAGIIEDNFNFDIYPNPTIDKINLVFSESKPRTIEIYSINGQLLLSHPEMNSEVYKIDVTEFDAGTYLINIIGDIPQRRLFIKN